MSVADTVQEILQGLTSGMTTYAQAFATGIKDFITNLLYTTTGTGSDATTSLSSVMTIVIVLGAIALAVGACRLVWNLIARIA